MSLESRALGPRLGVLTLEADAVVTASPSMVEGGRPFQTLEGLALLLTGASGHAAESSLDIPKINGLALAARCWDRMVADLFRGSDDVAITSGVLGRSTERAALAMEAKNPNECELALPLTHRFATGRSGVDVAEVEEGRAAWEKEGDLCGAKEELSRSAI